ncbi:uncharacterized protein [Diadema antillarum]|uniref:uncharacterized protein n=1 Tax=Diadema antillarum TaxID=105358 RepID=UPI003A8558A2
MAEYQAWCRNIVLFVIVAAVMTAQSEACSCYAGDPPGVCDLDFGVIGAIVNKTIAADHTLRYDVEVHEVIKRSHNLTANSTIGIFTSSETSACGFPYFEVGDVMLLAGGRSGSSYTLNTCSSITVDVGSDGQLPRGVDTKCGAQTVKLGVMLFLLCSTLSVWIQ